MRGGARSIILVSDGESTCDPDPCQVAEKIAEDGIDLRIDVVGLSVSGQARNQLKCIADAGKGDYFDADDAGDIEATLTRVAKRAVQPFTLVGEPISGGTEDDPTPITVGNWVDTIGGEDKFYVFERTQAGSTLRVSAVTQGSRGPVDAITVEIKSPEGRRCDLGRSTRVLDTRALSGAQATAGESTKCDQPGAYTVRVSRGRGSDEVPVGVRVTEEPQVDDPGFVSPAGEGIRDLEVRELSFNGTATPVAGAPSFENAPELTTGLWSSDIVAGEALVYRFRLEYGQSATVGLRSPAGTAAHREAFGGGPFSPRADFSLHNPLLAKLGFPDGGEPFGLLADTEESNFRTATPQVSKVTGQGGGKFGGGGDYTVAGDYYLSIGVSRKDNTIEIPFEIDLQIEGEPADGPTYVDGVSWSITDGLGESASEESPVSDESDDAEQADATKADAAARDASGNIRKGAGWAAALLGLAVLAASAFLLRRRKTA